MTGSGGHSEHMEQSRQWVVKTLREIGYPQAAESARHELPDPVEIDQLKKFGERHGITIDTLINGMGGSP
jgi:hypothetical protein